MNKKNHFEKLHHYYKASSYGYEFFLDGAQHFGYYPYNKKISEKEALILMQNLIGEKLNLKPNMKVIDAGCARGVVAGYLAEKFGCKIEAIDALPFLIQKARKRAQINRVSGKVNFSVMDYSKLKFKESSFDAVYSMETLCHSPDIGKTLKGFYRVLKKGGRIALFEYSISKDNEFTKYELKILNSIIKSSAVASLKDFRHGNLQKIVKSAGFKNIQVDDTSKNTLPSMNRYWKYAFVPYFFIKPFGLQEKFPNLTIAVEWAKMANKGLIKYEIFTAEK